MAVHSLHHLGQTLGSLLNLNILRKKNVLKGLSQKPPPTSGARRSSWNLLACHVLVASHPRAFVLRCASPASRRPCVVQVVVLLRTWYCPGKAMNFAPLYLAKLPQYDTRVRSARTGVVVSPKERNEKDTSEVISKVARQKILARERETQSAKKEPS